MTAAISASLLAYTMAARVRMMRAPGAENAGGIVISDGSAIRFNVCSMSMQGELTESV